MKKCGQDVKKFYANDNCGGCAICAKVCPNQNIEIIDQLPSWDNDCEQCMACLQWCPSVAINRRGVPENRLHYQNPGIEVEDLIRDMQRQAE